MKSALECVTTENVVEFSKYLQKKYNCTFIEKANSDEMQAIAWALNLMRIQDEKEFMNDFSITLGDRSYLCFLIGEGGRNSLLEQVVTMVHECQHVIQYQRNPAEFVIRYALSDSSRTHYEIDGYRTNFEMKYYFTGKVPTVNSIIDALKSYRIGVSDLHVAEKSLKSIRLVASRGGVYSGVSKDAIKWWNKKRKK